MLIMNNPMCLLFSIGRKNLFVAFFRFTLSPYIYNNVKNPTLRFLLVPIGLTAYSDS